MIEHESENPFGPTEYRESASTCPNCGGEVIENSYSEYVCIRCQEVIDIDTDDKE